MNNELLQTCCLFVTYLGYLEEKMEKIQQKARIYKICDRWSMVNLKRKLHWLYLQYLLFTGLYLMEPLETIVMQLIYLPILMSFLYCIVVILMKIFDSLQILSTLTVFVLEK